MTTPNLSREERQARSDRMRARNADPEFQAKRKAGQGWTSEKRRAAALRLELQRADPIFIAADTAARAARNPPPKAVPHNTMPIIRGLFVEMNDQRASLGDIASRSGVDYDTIRNWRKSVPHVDLLIAALNTLDLDLAIVPLGMRDDNGFVRKRAYGKSGERAV